LSYNYEIWFADRNYHRKKSDVTRSETGSKIAPQRPPAWKSIWPHISSEDGPIWTKFGSLMQSDTPSTVIWSKSRWDVKFQLADGCFSKPEVVISQPWIKICRWNWFGDRRWPSEDSYHQIGNRIGSSMEPPRPPSWNCIWRHYSTAGGPIWTKFGNLIQNRRKLLRSGRNHKGKKNSNIADVCYFQTGSSYISAVGAVVQLVEYRTRNRAVEGSTHTQCTASNLEQVANLL